MANGNCVTARATWSIQYQPRTLPGALCSFTIQGDSLVEVLEVKEVVEREVAAFIEGKAANGAPPAGPVAQEPGKHYCEKCGSQLIFKKGIRKSDGKPYQGWACSNRECRYWVPV